MQISLKAARVNANLTQQIAADKIGISRETLNKWETGKTSPDISQFDKLCATYNCSRDDIFVPYKLA